MEEISYCTREMVQDALGYADNPRANSRIDSAIRSSTMTIEGFLHRTFLPRTESRGFDMPAGGTLWLHDSELASAPTSFVSGDASMTSGTDYLLKPVSGPPYRWIEERTAGSVKFQAGATTQESIVITGDFSYPCRTLDATTLSESINAGALTLVVDNAAPVGVGSLLLIGTERLLITERLLSTTTATLAGNLTASKSETTIPVSDGTLINQGETIAIDGESMRVDAIVGNNLTVARGARGSVLAAHTSAATVYAPRACLVQRGMRGSAAAAHSSGAAVQVLRAPSLVEELAIALSEDTVDASAGAYARQQGSENGTRSEGGIGIAALMERAYTTYGRKVRTRAVM